MTLRKLRRLLLIFLVSVTGILALLFATLNLPFSERFATRKVNQILAGSKVPIHIRMISRILPNSVVVQGVLIEDLEGDTIIYVDKLHADIRLLALIRNKVVLEGVELSQASVKLWMNEKSLEYNIAEAFTAGRTTNTKKKDKAKSDWSISIQDGILSSVHFQMSDSISGIHILQDIEEIGIRNFYLPLADREIRAHTLELENVRGYISLASMKSEPKNETGKPWNFSLLNLSMNDIDVTVDQDQGDLFLHLILGEGEIRAKKMEMLSRVADIKSIYLKEAEATVLSSNRADDPKISPIPDPEESPWFFQAKDIDLEEIDISVGNQGDAGQDSSSAGIQLTGIEMKLKDFVFDQDQDQAGLKLNQLSFAVNQDFLLKNLKGELDSDRESIKLNLALETDRSQLNLQGRANQSLSGILSKPGEIQDANLAFSKTSISLRDFYPFIQAWQGNPRISVLAGQPVSVSGNLEMIKSLLTLSGVSFTQEGNFHVALEGRVEDPFLFSDATGDLNLVVSRVDTSWMKDLLRGMGVGGSLPALGGLTVEGQVSKSLSSSEFGLSLRSDLGKATGSGSLYFDPDSFSVQAFFENILLGDALDFEDLGAYNGSAKISGHGFTPEDFQASMTLLVDSLWFKDYKYTQTRIEGIFQPGEYNFHMVASDTFFTADLTASLIPADSAFQLKALGTVKAELNELHFFEDKLSVNTSMIGSFVHKQGSLDSELSLSDIVLANEYQRGEIKQIKATFKTDSVNTTLWAQGDFFTLDMQLAKPFIELESLGSDYGNYLASFTDPEHKNADSRVMSLPEIHATGKIANHEILDIILKDSLFHMDNLDLSIQNLANENRINYDIAGHGVRYKMLEMDSLKVAVIDSAGEMNIRVNLDDVSLFSGPEYDWLLESSFANLRSLSSFSIQDPMGPIVYDLEIATRVDSSRLFLEVPSKKLLLNRKQWDMESPDLLSVDLSTQTIRPAFGMYTGSSVLHLFEFTEEGKRGYQLELKQVEMESLVREDLIPGRPDASLSGFLRLKMLGDLERRLESDLQFSQVNYSDLKFDLISLKGHLDYGDSAKYAVICTPDWIPPS